MIAVQKAKTLSPFMASGKIRNGATDGAGVGLFTALSPGVEPEQALRAAGLTGAEPEQALQY